MVFNGKDIIYPLMIECSRLTDDVFWQNIFENLSIGKAPYGCYISKNHLMCTYKGKEFMYKLDDTIKSIDNIFFDIYTFLNKKLGLVSQKEKTSKQALFIQIEDQLKEENKQWSNIRKKNNKDMIIEKFVITSWKKYNLSLKKARYLLSLLYLLIGFKIVSNKDINYKNGVIESINGVELFENDIKITKKMYYTNMPILQEDPTIKINVASTWSKYITKLENSRFQKQICIP